MAKAALRASCSCDTCQREWCRREILRFFLFKTAAVRRGIKPGEILRIRHCYSNQKQNGNLFCLKCEEILRILELDYVELKHDPESSLILFYHPGTMRITLRKPENLRVLKQYGYPAASDPAILIDVLISRFRYSGSFPHEVGIFIGYPAKDVIGFIEKGSRTLIYQGMWAVFGETGESLFLMNLYRQMERVAKNMLDISDDPHSFFDRLAGFMLDDKTLAHLNSVLFH